jgi:hypothetical protein
MKHAQAEYITAGYMQEKSSSKRKAHVVAGIISWMLEQETESDYFDALYFIERGRKEARQEVKA